MKNSIPNLAKVSPIKDGYYIFRKWYLSLLLIRHLASSPVGMISITLTVVQAYGNDLAFPLGLSGTSLNWPFRVPWLVASLMSQPIKYLPAEHRRPGFDPWVGKTPWRRAWQLTPVFLPAESRGPRSLVGDSLWGRKEVDTTERLTQEVLVPCQN